MRGVTVQEGQPFPVPPETASVRGVSPLRKRRRKPECVIESAEERGKDDGCFIHPRERCGIARRGKVT